MTIHDILADDSNFDLIDRMARLEPGWQSGAEISFAIAGDDRSLRTQVRHLLNDLCARGRIDRMYIKHRSEPMACFLIIPAELNALLNEDD